MNYKTQTQTQKKEATEMKKVSENKKTLKLNLSEGYQGRKHYPKVNMDSIPTNEYGYKGIWIDLGDGQDMFIGHYAKGSGRIYIDVNEHGLGYRDSLSIEEHNREAVPSDDTTGHNGYEVTRSKLQGNKVQVTFNTFHESADSLKDVNSFNFDLKNNK